MAVLALPLTVTVVMLGFLVGGGRASLTTLATLPLGAGVGVLWLGWPYLLGALAAWAGLHWIGRPSLWAALAVGLATGVAFGLITGRQAESAFLAAACAPVGGIVGIAVWMAAYWRPRVS